MYNERATSPTLFGREPLRVGHRLDRRDKSSAAACRGLRRHRERRRAAPPLPVPARQGQEAGGRDGTKYSKYHTENYLSHHLAAISMSAVYTDACHIVIDDGVTGLKKDALTASSSSDEE